MYKSFKKTLECRITAFIVNIIGTAVILNGVYGFDVSLIQNIEITSVFFIWNVVIHHILRLVKEYLSG